MIKYRIRIIEDDIVNYELLCDKVLQDENLELVTNSNSINNLKFSDYLIECFNLDADVYIVDWALNFEDGSFSPEDIFNSLKRKKFNFLSKFWIFYSGPEGNKVSEFLSNYFPSQKYYITPGKGNILGGITKSGKDHFAEVMELSKKFIESINVPKEISNLLLNNTTTALREFAGKVYDIDDHEIMSSEGANVLLLNLDLFICMSYNADFGLFLYFDEHSRILRKALFRFSNSANEVKEKLDLLTVDVGRNFTYNPTFFDNNHIILPNLTNYLSIKLDNLLPKYSIKGRYHCDSSKLVKILNGHGILNE